MLYYITYTHLPSKKAFGYAIAKMCSLFAEHTPVTLVIPKSKERETSEDVYSFYGVPRNFSVLELPCIDLFRFGFLGSHIPFLIRKLTFAIAAPYKLNIQKNDICYSRDLWSLFLLRSKTPNLYLEIHYLSKLDALSVRLIHFSRKIIVITSFLKDELVSRKYESDKIMIAPSGIDLAEFERVVASKESLREVLDLPKEKKIVMYTGNLFAWKGVYTLLESLSFLNEDTVAVFIGGSKDSLPEFESEARKKPYSDRVHILGHIKHSEIAKFIKAADVLAIPNSAKENISKYNTSPIKLFEYMAGGVPIVASDLPSLRQILTHDEAYFAKPDDAQSLANAIKSALSLQDKSQEMAKRAKEKAGRYDWKERASKIWQFIHE